MEPFDVYCETCRARLRVREERFVGEIHPCPKCNSMVLIAAPAAATVADDAAGESTSAAVASTGGGIAAQLAGIVGRHAIVLSAVGAVLVVGGSLVVSMWGDDSEQVALRADETTAVAIDQSTVAAAKSEPESESLASPASEDFDQTEYNRTSASPAKVEPTTATPLPPLPALPAEDAVESPTDETVPSDEPPEVEERPTPMADVDQQRERTLRLDPLRFDPKRASLGNVTGQSATDLAPRYASEDGAKPQAAGAEDLAAQLGIPIQSIELPSTTLGEFVQMVSDMAAVPVKLDSSLAASRQMAVVVRGRDVTLSQLLDDVLAEHGLARIERGGQIVIIDQPTP